MRLHPPEVALPARVRKVGERLRKGGEAQYEVPAAHPDRMLPVHHRKERKKQVIALDHVDRAVAGGVLVRVRGAHLRGYRNGRAVDPLLELQAARHHDAHVLDRAGALPDKRQTRRRVAVAAELNLASRPMSSCLRRNVTSASNFAPRRRRPFVLQRTTTTTAVMVSCTHLIFSG